MKKRIRSRVLAAGMVSSTFFVGSGLFSSRALGQDRPSAADQLDRGSRLYDQKNYAEAKKILLDIDPAQLPEDQRAKLTDLLKNTDTQLARSSTPTSGYDAAQASLEAGKLVDADKGFQGVIDNAATPADLKEKAKIQLALVHKQQSEKASQMKDLLKQAEDLYNQGKLDESQSALATIQDTGSDLGWQDAPRVSQLQKKISDRRAAIAAGNGGGAGNVVAAAPNTGMTVPAANSGTAPAPTGSSAADAALAQPPVAGNAAPTIAPGAPAPAGSSSDSLLGHEAEIRELQHSRAIALYNQNIKASNDALMMNPPQYSAAVDRAQQALSAVNDAYSANLLSDAEASGYRATAQRQLDLATSRKQSYDTEQQKIAVMEAQKQNIQHAAKLESERHKRINDLMAQADRYYHTQQYRECANTLGVVVAIDPQNSSAKLFLELVTDRINNRDYQQLTDQRSAQTVRQDLMDDEEMIPYADLLVYPDDWVELSRRRLADLPDQESAANRAARARLDEELNEITAENQGFDKVVTFLQTTTGTNILVNWKALEAAGIDRNASVTVSLKKVPFKKALTEILAQVGGSTALAYTVDDGVITISTKDDLESAKYQTIRVFDIRDMLVQPDNNIQPPQFNLQQQTSGGQGGGGGQGLFTNTQTNQTTGNGQNSAQVVQEVIDTIETIVATDTWRDKGGQIGSIRELNGQLIVNQTADNQTAVYNLLQQLRETRAIQISIEARLLLVSNNFLDDFAFGWGLTIPAGALGGNVGAISVTNNTTTGAQAPGTGVPGTLGGGALANPSIAISGSIIDNYQLSLFLNATQADQRTVTVTSPRITLFNGQRGFLAVTQQRNYVSNFNQTVAAGGINGTAAVATTLTVQTLSTGIVLDVQATASADRRYVVMRLFPQLSTLDGIDTFSSAPTGNTGNTSSDTLALVQLPRISLTEVDTMVSVPDGGTLLIGGQKIVGESEIEVGVPILSKIPGLNRLFTNRQMIKDERTLLILVRPKIIIQKEIETGIFGPNYEQPNAFPSGQPTPGYNRSLTTPGFSSTSAAP